jgi:exodeoxyribonuclease VII large subunit
MMVVASGRLSHFGGQGRTQLLAVDIVPAGKGTLEIEFRRLLEKLMREGLTAPERKRPLPPYPERIVVITSPTGAVIRDICDTLGRRWPVAEIVHVDAEVQGPAAARSIVRAFEIANGMSDVDAVILARGGGSIEDLWAFNLEEVARAVAGSVHPVITGIGHEIDTTVADYVADLRAATPTAAAERATPLVEEVERRRAGLVEKLGARSRDAIENNRHLVEYLLRSGVFPALLRRVDRGAFELDDRIARLGAWWEAEQEDNARCVESSLARIDRCTEANLRRHRSALAANLAAVAEGSPAGAVRACRGALGHSLTMMRARLRGALALRREQSGGMLRALEGLDPRRVLERGYAVCTVPASGAVISRSREIAEGDRMMVNFSDGGALCAVERKGGATPWQKRRASRAR